MFCAMSSGVSTGGGKQGGDKAPAGKAVAGAERWVHVANVKPVP